MSIELDEKALRTLMSPKPSEALRDIVFAIDKSNEMNALSTMGRNVLRSCVSARKYQSPIPSNFNVCSLPRAPLRGAANVYVQQLEVDTIVMDHRLAKLAEVTGLLERLNIDGVATKPDLVAKILCAYVGASFIQSFKQRGIHDIHNSINDICGQLLNDDGDDDAAAQNDSANVSEGTTPHRTH